MPSYIDEQYDADHSSGYTETGYYPSPSVYDPKLSAEQWIEILHDETLTPPETLAMLRGMLALGGESTCAHLAKEYGNSAQYYNSQGMNFGRRVKKRYGLPDCMDGDTTRLFPIPFLGRYVSEYGTTHYSWKLRDELKEALCMFEKPSTKKAEKASLMEKNLILYGPPGTGKTYETIKTALEILQPDNVPLSRKEQKKAFDELKAKGHIGFVTFHQSFSYEDFVEGIRAETIADGNGSNTIAYDIVPGIFKDSCQTAARLSASTLKGPFSDFDSTLTIQNSTQNFWKISLGAKWEKSSKDIFEDCLKNNIIRLGYGKQTNFTDCHTREEVKEKAYSDIPELTHTQSICFLISS